MDKIDYIVDENKFSFSIENSPNYQFGKPEVLSTEETDISFHQDWYEKGFTVEPLMNTTAFEDLSKGITDCVRRIVEKTLNVNTDGFTLPNYHNWVKTDEDHLKIVSQSRDLFPSDFHFDIQKVMKDLGQILGFTLTDINPKDKQQYHIIIRINRPKSTDYNPPHKDMYESYDAGNGAKENINPFINFWIPICGITSKTSLPMAHGSHLIPENKILRTVEGGVISGKKYRVRMIKEWEGHNTLERAVVKNGEVLIFSSHLIHGLAVNEEADLTRVALEFRLFKAQ